MTPEAKVTADVRKFLKPLEKTGCLFVVKIAGGPRQQRGLPDIHLIFKGRAIWLEIKSAAGEPTPLQLHMIGKIQQAGGLAAVVRSVEDVKEMLRAAGADV